MIWLLGRLAPDDKVIADFRKDNGAAIKKVCVRFVELCRQMGLLTKASVAIDGSKFKAVNNRDKNFTRNKIDRRREQLFQPCRLVFVQGLLALGQLVALAGRGYAPQAPHPERNAAVRACSPA